MAVELKVNYREKYYFKDVHSSVDDEYKIDFNKGIWAAFENGEAEAYDLSKLENITELEPLTHMYEFNYRDFPRYLTAVIDNGKFRRFETEWKLVEKK